MSYSVELDTAADREQHEEELTVTWADGRQESMRLHEYDRVYAVPGLYEEVVQEQLACESPEQIARRLTARATELNLLDIGAGNGVLAETLRSAGVTGTLVGTDIEPEAKTAVERDRPDLYAEYVVGDLREIDVAGLIERHGLNGMVGAGALGHGHIAWEELERVWDLFPAGAWLAITAIPGPDVDAFADNLPDLVEREAFTHRKRMSGEPITYEVLLARAAT